MGMEKYTDTELLGMAVKAYQGTQETFRQGFERIDSERQAGFMRLFPDLYTKYINPKSEDEEREIQECYEFFKLLNEKFGRQSNRN